MLDARRLHTFLVAATEGSFTGAAKVLFMTHSAVSQQMAILEREVGLTLIERTSRGIALTDAGRQLAERCTRLFGVLASIESDMQDLRSRATRVRMGAFPTASAYLIPQVMRDFRHLHPAINLEFMPIHVADIPKRLRDGSIHLGLLWEYDFARRPLAVDIAVRHLVDEPLDVLMPRSHPLAGAGRVEFSDLADARWILRTHKPPYEDALINICRIAGFEPQIVFSSDDYQSIHGFVGAGLGISLVPRFSLQVRHPDVVALPTGTLRFHRRILAVTLAEVEESDAATKLIAVIQARVAQLARTPIAPHPIADVFSPDAPTAPGAGHAEAA